LIVGSYNHVNHGEEATLAGELKPACGWLPKANKNTTPM
jgi:hypothetical protein